MLEYVKNSSEESTNYLDARHQEVIKSGDFWKVYGIKPDNETDSKRVYVEDLFKALGKEGLWSANPEEWLEYTRKKWMGTEHGYSSEKEHFSEEQTRDALEVLEKMGFSGELVPPAGHYPYGIILGGFSGAFVKRLPWLRNHDIEVGRLDILAGHRKYLEARDGSIAEISSHDGKFGGRDISDDHGALWLLEDGRELNESKLARIFLSKIIGRLVLRGVTWSAGATENEKRSPQDYHFTAHRTVDGIEQVQDVVIMHGKPAERYGAQRPTTDSTFIEWLDRLAPPPNANGEQVEVVVVSGNPHTLRSIESLHRVLEKKGRTDIKLIPAGTLPASDAPIKMLQTALGEFVRLVDRSPSAHALPPTGTMAKAA